MDRRRGEIISFPRVKTDIITNLTLHGLGLTRTVTLENDMARVFAGPEAFSGKREKEAKPGQAVGENK